MSLASKLFGIKPKPPSEEKVAETVDQTVRKLTDGRKVLENKRKILTIQIAERKKELGPIKTADKDRVKDFIRFQDSKRSEIEQIDNGLAFISKQLSAIDKKKTETMIKNSIKEGARAMRVQQLRSDVEDMETVLDEAHDLIEEADQSDNALSVAAQAVSASADTDMDSAIEALIAQEDEEEARLAEPEIVTMPRAPRQPVPGRGPPYSGISLTVYGGSGSGSGSAAAAAAADVEDYEALAGTL